MMNVNQKAIAVAAAVAVVLGYSGGYLHGADATPQTAGRYQIAAVGGALVRLDTRTGIVVDCPEADHSVQPPGFAHYYPRSCLGDNSQ